MTVRIDVQFERSPEQAALDPGEIFGGVKVEAEGLVLTKLEGDGEVSEYIGERLTFTLQHIYDAIESVASGDVPGSEDVTAELVTDTAEKYAVVLSGYDGESVNVSLRNGSARDEIPDPSPAARSGRRVSVTALCRACIALLEEYREYRERVQEHLEQVDPSDELSMDGTRKRNRERIRATEEKIQRLRECIHERE